ncbi:MAG: AAA family ATPase [Nocardioidaceae bacterium]
MARLIHLNGPPGIGKSTLAQVYVDGHPGVLNLDIDKVRALIGGWRDRFDEAGQLARSLALGMAGAHLREGHDVIVPQYLGRLGEIERFEAVAVGSGAMFCEVVLMADKEQSLRRFANRSAAGELAWHRQVQEVVDSHGGPQLLAEMYDRLAEAMQRRPTAVVIPSEDGAISQTYEAFLTAVEASC